jgi:hypothetical protein
MQATPSLCLLTLRDCNIEGTGTVLFLHFSLGMWIRNTWTYGNEEKRIDALAKDLGEDVFWDADSMSSAILEGYKKYLKKSCTKDKK